jgi:HEAT repeat protein
MFKEMKLDSALQDKLDALVRGILPEGQGQVKALIGSVVAAGGTSETALVEMLRNRSLDPALRSNICWMVPRLKLAEAEDMLKALLSDPSERVREEAAAGLGLVSRGDAVEWLSSALEHDSSKAVRSAVLHALGLLSSPQSTAGVMKVLQNPNEDAELRADAAESLAHVEDERIVGALMDALHDSSPLVRYSAAYALGQQGDATALAALRDVAAHDPGITPWGSVASGAVQAIEAIANRNS